MKPTDTQKQIIEAIRTNHPEHIEKGSSVITSYDNLYKMLPDIHEDEIMAAIAEMNSVKILDSLSGSLQFFPTLF